jgi:hypothetical protein
LLCDPCQTEYLIPSWINANLSKIYQQVSEI